MACGFQSVEVSHCGGILGDKSVHIKSEKEQWRERQGLCYIPAVLLFFFSTFHQTIPPTHIVPPLLGLSALEMFSQTHLKLFPNLLGIYKFSYLEIKIK